MPRVPLTTRKYVVKFLSLSDAFLPRARPRLGRGIWGVHSTEVGHGRHPQGAGYRDPRLKLGELDKGAAFCPCVHFGRLKKWYTPPSFVCA